MDKTQVQVDKGKSKCGSGKKEIAADYNFEKLKFKNRIYHFIAALNFQYVDKPKYTSMIEKNIDNLIGAEAAQKIKELAEHSRSCVMMTNLDKRPISCRPMGIQKADDKGRLYFLSHKDSDKNAEINQSAEMQITITNDKNVEYISLYGHAEIYRDQKQIDEMYSSLADNWFDGKNDPNVTIIRFIPEAGHYWDTKHGKLLQFADMLLGAITKKKSDGGIQGDIKL